MVAALLEQKPVIKNGWDTIPVALSQICIAPFWVPSM